MNKIKVATVFSGIGAIEQALKILKINHEIEFACDNGNIEIEYDSQVEMEKIKKMKSPTQKREYVEKMYREKTRRTNFVKISYLKNYKINNNNFFDDIKLLDGNDFRGKIDLFVGGSPCQSFSTVGKQRGLEDARGTLFYEFARLINEIKPKVFIYENVRGLYNHDKGNTWKIMKIIFEQLGYETVVDKVLNSKDYGIPQNRNRIFVVGIKKKVNFFMPKPVELKYLLKDFLLDNCKEGDFKYLRGKIKVSKIPGKYDPKYFLSEKLLKYVMSSGTKTFYQKPEIDLDVARPILATMGNRHRAGIDNYVTINGKIRMLTEREALRLMGFPDSFKLVVSRAQGYKQAGNSIAVPVLIEILKQIVEVDNEENIFGE